MFFFLLYSVVDRLKRSQTDSKYSNRIVNVFCAGDDDQSIYGYRGAKVELMQRFRFDFPGSKVLKFGVSYRLPDDICKATQSFISASANRIPKPLVSGHISLTPQGGDVPLNNENYYMNVQGNNQYRQDPIDTSVIRTVNSSNNDEYNEVNIVSARASIEIRSMLEEEEEINWIVSYLKNKMLTNDKSISMNRNIQNQDPESTRVFTNNQNHQGRNQGPGSADYSIVILTRYGAQLRLLEEGLKDQKVPFLSRNFGFWNQQVCTL